MSISDYTDYIVIGSGERVDIHDSGRGEAGGVATLGENGQVPSSQLPISALLDIFYPIGSYLETSDGSYDPNASLGGSWIKETEGIVHVSGGINYPVSKADDASGAGVKDGGNKDAIIPYHRHYVQAFNTGNSSPSTNSAGNHSHTTSLWNLTTALNGAAGLYAPMVEGAGARSYSSSTNGSHSHTVNSHSHSVGAHNTDYVGTSGNTTDANMQPYINVYRWHRVA